MSETNTTVASESMPLTAAQLGVWYAQQLSAASPVYNLAQYVEIRGPVRADLLEAAIHRAERECGTFDVRFVAHDEDVRQTFVEPAGRPLRTVDVSAAPDPVAAAHAWMEAARKRPLDIERDELSGDALVVAAPDHHFWYNACHHLVADGFSCTMLTRRVVEVYRALVAGTEPGPALGHVSQALRDDAEYRASDRYAADRDHWTSRFASPPDLVTLARRAPTGVPNDFIRRTSRLAPESLTRMQLAAREHRTTWTVLVVAAVAAYLHQMTGARDVTVGVAVSARQPSSRAVPAMMANELPLLVHLGPDTTKADLVRQVGVELSALLRHQAYPYDLLRRDLRLVADNRHLFGVVVNILSTGEGLDFAGLPTRVEGLSNGPIRDLNLTVYKESADRETRIDFDANEDTYHPAEVATHQERFLRLLDAFTEAAPDTMIGTFDLGTADERQLLLGDFQPVPRTGGMTGGVGDRFARQAALGPDRPALVGDLGTVSYGELARRADALARRLVAAGVRPEDRVPLLIRRSPELVVAILATLRAGACYVPIDERAPAGRTAAILDELDAPVVLADRPVDGVGAVLRVDEAGEPSGAALPPVHPDQTAYVMFTSGSTGTPKGVAVTHANIVDLADDRAYDDYAAHRVLHHSPQAFDASTYELWAPLLHGGTVVIAPPAELDLPTLRRILVAHRVTALWLTAGLFRLVAEEDPACLATVREVWTGGDVVPAASVARVLAANPGVRVVDGYGPTETTTFASAHVVGAVLDDPVPIGRPLDGMRAYVLDAGLRLAPVGATGEPYLAGAGVARGYLGRAARTAERFVADPYGAPGGRMYRTGDLARWTADGRLVFGGRVDHQVKIRGFRVEPGEIESVLARHPGVAQTVVTAPVDRLGGRRLVAYVVPAAGEVDVADLRSHVAALLPDYLAPASYVMLDALPLTGNGKVDRRELPVPERATRLGGAPQTQREQLLCGLFAEVLGVPEVGVDDDFFDLGGDSIRTLQLAARAHRAGVAVDPADVFRHPTVGALAEVAVPVADNDAQVTPVDDEPMVTLDLDELEELEAQWEAAL